jgi:hypothetical protein
VIWGFFGFVRFGGVMICTVQPCLAFRDMLSSGFVLWKNWNFGISTGYPQAKSLILNGKMTIPEKIPAWNKLYLNRNLCNTKVYSAPRRTWNKLEFQL